MRNLGSKHFFFLFVLLLGILGFYAFGNSQVPDETPEYDLSKITITAHPAEEHMDKITDADETKEAKVKEDAQPAGFEPASKSVCLDPGHGGDDPGAMKGRLSEREINLITAKKVHDLLETKGYTAYMTRTTNEEGLSKQDRYSFCNDNNASILVAIHHNSYGDTGINYTTALYYSEYDQLLAESIARSTSASLKLENKGIAWFDNRVLSKSKMPATFSEAFFMTNSADYAKLVRKDYSRLDKEAAGIVNGIISYFDNPAQFKPTFASEELKIDRTDW